MKIQMDNILLLCVLAISSLEIAGVAKCLGCYDVGRDNNCKKKAYVCFVGKGRSCFIRRTEKNGKIENITRGCTSSCKTRAVYRRNHDTFTWCCSSDNCNAMNAWF